MAKTCPITKDKVLYLECLECESRDICKDMGVELIELNKLTRNIQYVTKINRMGDN